MRATSATLGAVAQRPPTTNSADRYSTPWLPFDARKPSAVVAGGVPFMDWYYPTRPLVFTFSQGEVIFTDIDARWNNTSTVQTIGGKVTQPGQPVDSRNAWGKLTDRAYSGDGGRYLPIGGVDDDRPLRERPLTPGAPFPLSPYVTTTPGGRATSLRRDARVLDKRRDLLDSLLCGMPIRLVNTLEMPGNDLAYDLDLSVGSGGPGYNWHYQCEFLEAAQMLRDEGYPVRVAWGLDGGSQGTRQGTDPAHPAAPAAQALLWCLKTWPDVFYRQDGVEGPNGVFVACWAPDFLPGNAKDTTRGKAWLTDFLDTLKAAGHPVTFAAAYQAGDWRQRHEELVPGRVSVIARWGDRDEVSTTNDTPSNAGMGNEVRRLYPQCRYMSVASREDERRDQYTYYEARGFRQLIASCKIAAGDATHLGSSYVHLPTGSDFRENTQTMPTRAHGWTTLQIVAHMAERVQTGQTPTVLRPALFLAHRPQVLDVVTLPSGATVQLRKLRATREEFPATGVLNYGYIAYSTGVHYYWNGSAYVDLATLGLRFPNTYTPYNNSGVMIPQREFMVRAGSAPGVDRLYGLAILDGPATLTLTAPDGTATAFSVTPDSWGLAQVDVPLAGVGSCSGLLTRGGVTLGAVPSGTLPPVSRTLDRQSYKYLMAGSLPAPGDDVRPPT